MSNKKDIKHIRNSNFIFARTRNAGKMKHKLAPQKGAKNEQQELLKDLEEEIEEDKE